MPPLSLAFRLAFFCVYSSAGVRSCSEMPRVSRSHVLLLLSQLSVLVMSLLSGPTYIQDFRVCLQKMLALSFNTLPPVTSSLMDLQTFVER